MITCTTLHFCRFSGLRGGFHTQGRDDDDDGRGARDPCGTNVGEGFALSLSLCDRPRGVLPPGPSTSDPPFMHELMQALILERSRKTIHMQLPCFMGLKGTVVAEVATRCDEFGFLY